MGLRAIDVFSPMGSRLAERDDEGLSGPIPEDGYRALSVLLQRVKAQAGGGIQQAVRGDPYLVDKEARRIRGGGQGCLADFPEESGGFVGGGGRSLIQPGNGGQSGALCWRDR